MNILNIMWKEIKQNFRDRKSMTMMVLFPIVLILILGTALSNNFDNSNAFKGASVIYSIKGTGELEKGFRSLVSSEKELGIEFVEAKNDTEGLNGVKDRDYSAYVLVDSTASNIKLYKNNKFNLNGSFIESMLNTFVQKYNVMVEIAKVNPLALEKINSNGTPDFIKEVSIAGKKQPKSLDYYAVSMLTLILMYAAMTSASSINNEKRMRTSDRMLMAPVGKYEVLIGRILGDILITAFQAAIVLIFSKYILKTYWGEAGSMLPILAVVFSEILFSVSLGAGVAFMIKNEQLGIGLINTLIPFAVFLGGGYVPLDQFNSPMLNTISKISPLRWINDSIFQVIYSHNFSLVPKAVIISLIISIIFIIASTVIYRKEAA